MPCGWMQVPPNAGRVTQSGTFGLPESNLPVTSSAQLAFVA